jgi:hypothetical protein
MLTHANDDLMAVKVVHPCLTGPISTECYSMTPLRKDRQMKLRHIISFALICAPAAAGAGSLEESLLKLPPEEQARQACIVKGIDQIRRDKRLSKADRLKTSILNPAELDGTVVTAKGAAVHAKDRWYALKFTCAVSKDLLKASSFVYEIGPEIPREKWEDLGLWE